MKTEPWNSEHPDLRAPITYDQQWFSALLIELENCSQGIRELAKILREGPQGGPKA